MEPAQAQNPSGTRPAISRALQEPTGAANGSLSDRMFMLPDGQPVEDDGSSAALRSFG